MLCTRNKQYENCATPLLYVRLCIHVCTCSYQQYICLLVYMSSVYECIWVYMSVYACIWVYMSVYEFIGVYMSVHECIWAYMSKYECIWVYMSVYECIWVYMKLHIFFNIKSLNNIACISSCVSWECWQFMLQIINFTRHF